MKNTRFYIKNKCNINFKNIFDKYTFYCFFQEKLCKQYLNHAQQVIDYHYLSCNNLEEDVTRVGLMSLKRELKIAEDCLFSDLEEGEDLYYIYNQMFTEVRRYIYDIQLKARSMNNTLLRNLI